MKFHVRDYQTEAAEIFYAGGDAKGGSGVIVLPCGSGKTIVGIVRDVRGDKLENQARPQLYHPHDRSPVTLPECLG